MKVAVIIVAGTRRQNECFWPSYNLSEPGIGHDLIVIHRNMAYVPNIVNKTGNVILENKVYTTGELPYKAFGAYREYWNRYKNNYDIFAFISDDVIIKSDDWLSDAINMLITYNRLGFVGTQVFNGMNKEYPHPSHNRAPCWFAKSSALKEINWAFSSDHDGEMKLADQFLEAKYFGAQIGNKIDTAYDAIENGGYHEGDHISSLIEKEFNHNLKDKFSIQDKNKLNEIFKNKLFSGDNSIIINSPHKHIGKRYLISQLQPFNGLIFDKSKELAVSYIDNCPFNINILKKYL